MLTFMKRTNFYFPDDLLEGLRKAKEITGIPMTTMIRAAVRAYLKSLGLQEEVGGDER